ncbi:modification methylase [Clostridium perfringens]|uniref:adenine-specific methyltransferase EcoRI family protein n=1 Tax=Clostridium perfringens TaxID=1502 RepID=UPI001CD03B23|nr:adenine-specific methyltransferase EcoRI family protein [Clostridium perfringens]UBK49377.1 modification methylase [Clostridium perfringens]
MSKKRDLLNAKKAKKDEFYTRIEDIEKELKYYKKYFENKIIFCNCDDPYESNFFKYFALNFNFLGLKKLIATCYTTSPIVCTQLSVFNGQEKSSIVENGKKAYKIEITEVIDSNKDGAIDLTDIEYLIKNKKNILTVLEGDGDFRSEECISLLRECDIVVTNPPFSLFRDYIALLADYEKDFIIIGNTNSLTYKEVFKLFKENKIRTGYTNFNVGMYFVVPDYYEKYTKIENGVKLARVSTSCWFTTLPVDKHNDEIVSYKKYNPNEYKKYENYDAINVDTYTDIPCDYNGIMGVPITFLDKYNPNQFEIIGLGISTSGIEVGVKPYKEEHKKYRREVQKRGAVDGDLYMLENGIVKVPYARILIRRLK